MKRLTGVDQHGGLRPLVELCVEPAGLCGRCTGASVPLRVVPSSTGLPSKRFPGIGFFSRAYRKIGSVLLQKTTKALGLVSEKILANHDSMDRGGIIISSLIFSAKLRKENKSS